MGRGWKDDAPKPSPYAIDTGSTLASLSTEQCVGPPAVAKTETDMLVTGGSMSIFTRLPESVVSIVMLFRSERYAQTQVSAPPSSLKPCLVSELKKAGAAGSVSVVSLRRYSLERARRTATLVDEAQELVDLGAPEAPVVGCQALGQRAHGNGLGIEAGRIHFLDQLDPDLPGGQRTQPLDLSFELLFSLLAFLLTAEHCNPS